MRVKNERRGEEREKRIIEDGRGDMIVEELERDMRGEERREIDKVRVAKERGEEIRVKHCFLFVTFISIGTIMACRGDSQKGHRPPQCSVSTEM